jgi:DNA-binding CsgD family transcriptional regulator/tetratricopeptide (TPR) repeat protein
MTIATCCDEISARAFPSGTTESPVSPEARHLLEVAAVLGPSFAFDQLVDVLGRPAAQLLPSLRETLDAGIVEADADGLKFTAAPGHEAVLSGVPAAARGALHQQIGTALLNRGRPAAAAPHLLAAARTDDPAVVSTYLDRAAKQLALSAPGDAAPVALRALELTGRAEPSRGARTLRAVACLLRAGRIGEATDLATRALDGPGFSGSERGEVRLALASARVHAGRPTEAIALADSVLAGLPLGEPPGPGLAGAAQQIRLLGRLAQGDGPELRRSVEDVLAGDLEPPEGDPAPGGAPRATGGLDWTGDGSGGFDRASDGVGPNEALVAALGAWGAIAWSEGRAAEASLFLRAALRRPARDVLDARPHPRLALATVAMTAGRFSEAAGLLTAAEVRIDVASDRLWAAAPAISRARLELSAGRVDAAEAEAQRGLALAADLSTPLFAPLARAVLAEVALRRGDVSGAAGLLAYDRPQACGLLGWGLVPWVRARLAGATGSSIPRPTATAGAGPAGAGRDGAGMDGVGMDGAATDGGDLRLLLEEPAAAAWLVRLALGAGDRAGAERVARTALLLVRANPGAAVLVAAADHARGLLDDEPDRLEAAMAGHRHPWARASAAEDAGIGRRRRGEQDGARSLLEAALAGYGNAGAPHDAARIRARLREAGVRRRHWTDRQRPVSGWQSLTETQHTVAELVASGLTNQAVADRMFLSRHTVDFHLRQIFRKLGVDSRVALAGVVLRVSAAHGSAGSPHDERSGAR